MSNKVEELYVDKKNKVAYVNVLAGNNVYDMISEMCKYVSFLPEGYSARCFVHCGASKNGRTLLVVSHENMNKTPEEIFKECDEVPFDNSDSSIYYSIDDLEKEIEALDPDGWKTEEGIRAYLKILVKVAAISDGYSFDTADSRYGFQTTNGEFPSQVLHAVACLCSKKFPALDEVDAQAHDEGVPTYAYLLPFARSEALIRNLYTQINRAHSYNQGTRPLGDEQTVCGIRWNELEKILGLDHDAYYGMAKTKDLIHSSEKWNKKHPYAYPKEHSDKFYTDPDEM